MNRATWDEVFMDVARAVARRSRCSKAQVGAVIVNTNNRIVSTGYNGPAYGDSLASTDSCSDWCIHSRRNERVSAGYDDCPSIHAEANALLYSSRQEVEGSTLYVTHSPCIGCSKLIANSGIEKVVIIGEIDENRGNTTYYLRTCGLEVVVMDEVA